jgi:excisionase family DNA binding protein
MLDTDQAGYLTVAEAAKRLRVSHPTVWRWIKSGKLAAYRVGPKIIRVKEADLAALVQPVERAQEPKSTPGEAPTMQTTIGTRRLTDEERERALEALAELDALRDRMMAARNGRPFPSSVELIRKEREARSRHLDRL